MLVVCSSISTKEAPVEAGYDGRQIVGVDLHRWRSVVVRINDRGPFVRGRVLDLSTGAARAIGLTGAGVGRVTAEVVS